MRANKSFSADILVIIFCVLGFMLCLFLFQCDLNAALKKLGEQPVGTITFRYNMAQRRFIDRLIWDRLRNESPLYNGDIIRTADLSEATITFTHGDIIDIASNTLIQIFVDNAGSRIDFSGGGISVNASSGMVISSGNNRIAVEAGSSLRAAKGDEAALDISVSEGAAFLDALGETAGQTIAAGSGIFLSADGERVPIAQAVAVSPQSGARILSPSAQGVSVDFIWNKINYPPNALTRLEIAQDRKFNRLSFAEDSSDSQLGAVLGEGTWYWRLYPLTADGAALSTAPLGTAQEIPYSRLIIAHNPVPALISPGENQEISYRSAPAQVRFIWSTSPEASSYNLEAANNPSMQNPALNINVRSGSGNQLSALSSGLGEGTWYWRVTPVYGRGFEGSVVSSAVQGFVLKHDPNMAMTERNLPSARGEESENAHRLVFPPNNYTIADNLLPDMRFTWKTNLENNRFQFSQSGDFSNLLIDESAPGEAYVIRSMPGGVYYWRITAIDAGQQKETQMRRITIADSLPPPQLSRVSNLDAGQNEFIVIRGGRQIVDFNWQRTPGAEYYVFRLHSGDGTQPPIFETILNNTAISINMGDYSDGAYTWTVQAFSRENNTSSRRTGVSASQSINIRHLRPVILEHPYNGMEYVGIDASRNPGTARWSSEQHAADTLFILARDARMTDIVLRRANVPFSFALPRLAGGNYYWTITAFTDEGLDISSIPSHFRVQPIPPFPVPENRIPADGHTIRPEHIRNSRSVAFSWSAVRGANRYILTIFQGTGRGRTTIIQTPPMSETSYTVEDIRLLGRGNFFWQVEALHILEDGFIEQRGQLRENRLNVDIPTPPQIRTIDSGILYGN